MSAQSSATQDLTFSVTMKMDPTSCSRTTVMEPSKMWRPRQVRHLTLYLQKDFQSYVSLMSSVMMEGVEDRYQHGRGVALADFNGDGKTDIVYGNWNGPHRLYLQDSQQRFKVRLTS